MGHAPLVVRHAEMSLTHARAAAEISDSPHIGLAIEGLESAINHGGMGHAEIAMNAAQEALKGDRLGDLLRPVVKCEGKEAEGARPPRLLLKRMVQAGSRAATQSSRGMDLSRRARGLRSDRPRIPPGGTNAPGYVCIYRSPSAALMLMRRIFSVSPFLQLYSFTLI